jgi:hypothetical protein
MSLKEDTVSADRKQRIIFDPDAWRKSDKSGKKTTAIASRQNFDNEKFTRKAQDKVDEGTIQPSGDSKVDSAGPTQSDTISKEKHKKSNNPQIEFVSGTAQPNGSSSTAMGGAQATGRKIAEACMKIRAAKKQSNIKQEETKMSTKTYSQFVEELDQLVEFVESAEQLDEYNAKDGVYRHKGSYGGGYSDPEGSDDADDKPKAAPAPVVKKGRGRPSGSYGTYKARSADTKAAAAAKSAASKAANKSK